MLELFDYQFIRYSFIAALLVSITAPLLGVFLVARRQALISDTVSHTSLAGISLALLIGIHPLIGALISAFLAVLVLEKVKANKKLTTDSIQSLLMAGGLAFAILVISFRDGSSLSIESYLFGSILATDLTDLIALGVLTISTALFVRLNWSKLITLTVNEELAAADGIRTSTLKAQLALLVAAFIALSLKIIGGLLIGAMVVIPVITAASVAKSFKQTTIFAIFLCVFASSAGILMSFYFNFPVGPSIVLTAITMFILSIIAKIFTK